MKVRKGVYEGVSGTIDGVVEDLDHHIYLRNDEPGLPERIIVNIKHLEEPDEKT